LRSNIDGVRTPVVVLTVADFTICGVAPEVCGGAPAVRAAVFGVVVVAVVVRAAVFGVVVVAVVAGTTPPIAFLTGPPVMYFILVVFLNPSMLLTFLVFSGNIC
jgi:hypothetical protein